MAPMKNGAKQIQKSDIFLWARNQSGRLSSDMLAPGYKNDGSALRCLDGERTA